MRRIPAKPASNFKKYSIAYFKFKTNICGQYLFIKRGVMGIIYIVTYINRKTISSVTNKTSSPKKYLRSNCRIYCRICSWMGIRQNSGKLRMLSKFTLSMK